MPGRDHSFYEMLIEICMHKNTLPQGSPSSPIISNMIMYRFDKEIKRVCDNFGLSVTRYADDIIISSKSKTFPVKFAFRLIDGGREITSLGPILQSITSKNGLTVNNSKTALINTSYRMRVTGIVVNEKMNLEKVYVKRLRTMIHILEIERLEGRDGFIRLYSIDRKKSFGSISIQDVEYVKEKIRGKLYYLRFIKGDYDPTYRKLASRYKSFDDRFKFDVNKFDLSHIQILIRTEGTTDKKHLEMALSYFNSKGIFKDLNLIFMDHNNNTKGSANMMQDIRYESKIRNSSNLKIFLFDADEKKTIDEMSNNGTFKRHSSGLYSMILPKPENRDGKICIEMFYTDENIRKIHDDSGKKRLYFRNEFNDGWHISEHTIYTHYFKDAGLIADHHVYNAYNKEEVCLRKGVFANLIQDRTDIDFTEFSKIFDEIKLIRNEYYKNDVLKSN